MCVVWGVDYLPYSFFIFVSALQFRKSRSFLLLSKKEASVQADVHDVFALATVASKHLTVW